MARDRKSDAHRTIATKKLGRKLGPSEVVDHLDGDKSNNAPANLGIKSRSAHTTKHNKQRPVDRLNESLTMHKRGKKLY